MVTGRLFRELKVGEPGSDETSAMKNAREAIRSLAPDSIRADWKKVIESENFVNFFDFSRKLQVDKKTLDETIERLNTLSWVLNSLFRGKVHSQMRLLI